jgi:hypothetical protein
MTARGHEQRECPHRWRTDSRGSSVVNYPGLSAPQKRTPAERAPSGREYTGDPADT